MGTELHSCSLQIKTYRILEWVTCQQISDVKKKYIKHLSTLSMNLKKTGFEQTRLICYYRQCIFYSLSVVFVFFFSPLVSQAQPQHHKGPLKPYCVLQLLFEAVLPANNPLCLQPFKFPHDGCTCTFKMQFDY